MKINELIQDFSIFTSNEERAVLETIDSLQPLSSFNEREQVIITNLIRKSLISKIMHHGNVMVVRNEKG